MKTTLVRKAKTTLRKAADALAETLWPTRCVCCDYPGTLICPECAAKLPVIDPRDICPLCGAPHGSLVCTECGPAGASGTDGADPSEPFPFTRARSAFSHQGYARTIITAYKDAGERRLQRYIAAGILLALKGRLLDTAFLSMFMEEGPEDDPLVNWCHNYSTSVCEDWGEWAEALVRIPANPRNLQRRGFDHMAPVAQLVAAFSGLPLIDCLAPCKQVADQRLLSAQERRENLKDAFEITTDALLPKRIVLMDDVFTTGSTLASAAETLQNAGIEEVRAATFARVW